MDFDKKNKRKPLNCMLKGPGPQYKLKSLTGYEDHDPSKRRQPAYTMKFRHKARRGLSVPGPYPISGKMTHHGLEMPPAYSMVFKPRQTREQTIPGPGAYKPEKYLYPNHVRQPPAYTITLNHDKFRCGSGPGPAYMLPTCIGPEIPDLRAEAAYSMAFKRKYKKIDYGPGPAAYETKLNVYKRVNPAFSMKFRHEGQNLCRTPGPKYSFSTDLLKKRQPQYSFGVKYSECATVGIMEDD